MVGYIKRKVKMILAEAELCQAQFPAKLIDWYEQANIYISL